MKINENREYNGFMSENFTAQIFYQNNNIGN